MDELGFGQAAPTQVKKDQAVFKSLRPPPSGVIELDTPSPAQKKQKSNTCSSATITLPSNPSNAVLALSSPDEEEEQSLECALEAEMDRGFPSVEEKTRRHSMMWLAMWIGYRALRGCLIFICVDHLQRMHM